MTTHGARRASPHGDRGRSSRTRFTSRRGRQFRTPYDLLMTSEPLAPETFISRGSGGVRIVADRLGGPQARAGVFWQGGAQPRRSWGRAAAAVAERGWQAVTIDLRGHGEPDWSSDGDYRVVSFANDVQEVLRPLPEKPVLV